MNPLPDWKPRPPAPELRESLFGHPPAPRTRTPRATTLWPSVGLVLAMSWSGALMLWIHGDVVPARERPALDVSSALGLVAQNSVPVAYASFAFTNASLLPSTNASFSGTNSARN
jgi:hypothetical protein